MRAERRRPARRPRNSSASSRPATAPSTSGSRRSRTSSSSGACTACGGARPSRAPAPALEAVGLAGEERKRAGLLSKGMQRRLALARALLCDPAILLIDEATHDLDPDGARRVRALVDPRGSGTLDRGALDDPAPRGDRRLRRPGDAARRRPHALLRLRRRPDRPLARPPLRADDADGRAGAASSWRCARRCRRRWAAPRSGSFRPTPIDTCSSCASGPCSATCSRRSPTPASRSSPAAPTAPRSRRRSSPSPETSR